MIEMKLFCLPYAGGSESAFYSWKGHMQPDIEICPIQLKGRGRRFNEPCYESLEEAVQDIFEQVQAERKGDDYALFGHSMGSLLAYELYYQMSGAGAEKPVHIFSRAIKRQTGSERQKNCIPCPILFLRKKLSSSGERLRSSSIMKSYLNCLSPFSKATLKW